MWSPVILNNPLMCFMGILQRTSWWIPSRNKSCLDLLTHNHSSADCTQSKGQSRFICHTCHVKWGLLTVNDTETDVNKNIWDYSGLKYWTLNSRELLGFPVLCPWLPQEHLNPFSSAKHLNYRNQPHRKFLKIRLPLWSSTDYQKKMLKGRGQLVEVRLGA